MLRGNLSDSNGKKAAKGAIKEFCCGGGAAAINIVLTFPPNKLMFRQQLYGYSLRQAYDSMTQEGWGKLYRGVKPPLVQSMISKSLMFGLYSWFDTQLSASTTLHNHLNTKHIAAFCAGTTEAILTPFERAQTLLQIPKYNVEIKGAIDAVVHINEYGIKEHYRGLSAVLLRNGPTNVAFFGLRDPLKSFVKNTDSGKVLSPLMSDFFCGAVLGACLSTTFFPLNVARARMQSELGGEAHLSVREALVLVYNERGRRLQHMYRGVHLNFTRSLFSWGIINSSYEYLKKHL